VPNADALAPNHPPKFVHGEVARVVTATGDERDASDEPLDAQFLIDHEVIVLGAQPTAAQDGWTIHAWVESLDDDSSFPEEALVSAGEIELEDEDGSKHREPLDPTRDRWRDDVLLTVTTDTTSSAEAKAIAERAAETLAGIERVGEVEWRLTEWSYGPVWITLWAWSDIDALEAFEEIVALTSEGWEHDEDERIFITSKWTRIGESQFLAAGVQEAEVCYRRWTTPRRRSRTEITSRSAQA
jgi:hypothetical protein